VPERLNGTVSKTVVGFGPPWVRIPPSPLNDPEGFENLQGLWYVYL
jgi:hypothetical protein